MIDLTTRYLGLKLKNSARGLVASPLWQGHRQYPPAGRCRRLRHRAALAVRGADHAESGVLDRFLTEGTESFGEALSYFPDMVSYNIGPDGT